jgi:phasin family protein
MINGFEDYQKLSKENLDAAVKNFATLSKGMQTIVTEVADVSKKNFEASTAAFEKVSSAKTIDKALEAQADYVKSAFEEYVSQVSKFGELYADVAKEVYKPIEQAVTKATNAATNAATK